MWNFTLFLLASCAREPDSGVDATGDSAAVTTCGCCFVLPTAFGAAGGDPFTSAAVARAAGASAGANAELAGARCDLVVLPAGVPPGAALVTRCMVAWMSAALPLGSLVSAGTAFSRFLPFTEVAGAAGPAVSPASPLVKAAATLEAGSAAAAAAPCARDSLLGGLLPLLAVEGGCWAVDDFCGCDDVFAAADACFVAAGGCSGARSAA